jgi:hypothetical protein
VIVDYEYCRVHGLMTERRAVALIAGFLFLGITVGASADSAIEGSAPLSKPVNIKVLPKNLSGAEIGKIMKRFEADLGVKCGHCHVEDPNTQKFAYASDENPAKNTARMMITMLNDINEKYLPQLGQDRRYAAQVTCGSCHQGQSSPPAFE